MNGVVSCLLAADMGGGEGGSGVICQTIQKHPQAQGLGLQSVTKMPFRQHKSSIRAECVVFSLVRKCNKS